MQTKQTLHWTVRQNSESLMINLSGELTRDSLLPLWKQRASFLPQLAHQIIYWDLGNLTRIDSAGFALLTELLHHYRQQTQNVLLNPPKELKTLAALFNLQDWLNPFLIHDSQK